jgi:23S rRNA (cytosine1962-C5)-methyltransferase
MMLVWRLKTGADRRIRSGHPWIFSNELEKSPKGTPLGEPIELQDSRGQFLARGYGNPHSLIAFRALSFSGLDREPWSFDSLHSKVLKSWEIRKSLGFRGSFRLSFGESDYIPGLVLDYYLIEQNGKKSQLFAAQLVTAGMDLALRDRLGFFKGLAEKALASGLTDLGWEQTAVVIRNDVSVRKLEGLTIDEPVVIKDIESWNLRSVDILLNAAQDDGVIRMQCDLVGGQKTGFFLDQTQNIFLATGAFKNWALATKPKKVKILDLCCYVGHWATQITRTLRACGVEVEVHLLDVSKPALEFAANNARREGAEVFVHQMDVLERLPELPGQSFDIVIADPPAFIKAKKDVPIGKHAYLKINTQAFRVVKPRGFVVSCSCSGLLEEEDFRDALRKAAQRNFSEVRSIMRGGHAADHPTLMNFPEGFYLKMYVHQMI